MKTVVSRRTWIGAAHAPQPLFALGHLALYFVADFLTFIGGEAAMGQLREQLRDLGERIK